MYVSGSVHVRPFPKIPTGSCHKVYIKEDIYCDDCDIPILDEVTFNVPQSRNEKLKYTLKFNDASAGTYLIFATLHIGWCARKEQTARIGDYQSEGRDFFTLGFDNRYVSKDITVEKLILNGED